MHGGLHIPVVLVESPCGLQFLQRVELHSIMIEIIEHVVGTATEVVPVIRLLVDRREPRSVNAPSAHCRPPHSQPHVMIEQTTKPPPTMPRPRVRHKSAVLHTVSSKRHPHSPG